MGFTSSRGGPVRLIARWRSADLFFKFEGAVVPGSHAVFGEPIRSGDMANADAIKGEEVQDAIVPPVGMFQAYAEDPIDHLRWSGLRI